MLIRHYEWLNDEQELVISQLDLLLQTNTMWARLKGMGASFGSEGHYSTLLGRRKLESDEQDDQSCPHCVRQGRRSSPETILFFFVQAYKLSDSEPNDNHTRPHILRHI